MGLAQMKKLPENPLKLAGPKKFEPKLQEVEVAGEKSWGGETPEELKKKLGKQLLMLKLEDRKLKEKDKKDLSWVEMENLKSKAKAIQDTREQLKK